MKKLLLTGFEPFLEFPINPTEKIVQQLNRKQIGDYEVIGELLPVDFQAGPEKIVQLYHCIRPDAVISLGLAAGRAAITPERIAINCRGGEPDNKGVVLEDEHIAEDGLDGYFSTLPLQGMISRLKENGYPASISNTAGTYLCNHVMYSILHEVKKAAKPVQAGFIHIPASHELVLQGKKSMPSWSDQDLFRAIELTIETLS
jgi:pyroglutamyl-peptidase